MVELVEEGNGIFVTILYQGLGRVYKIDDPIYAVSLINIGKRWAYHYFVDVMTTGATGAEYGFTDL